MQPIGVDGSTTSHGGMVNATQTTTTSQGKAWLRVGDGFACPVCKVWSTLIPNNTTVMVQGKFVSLVGDSFTCGAKLMPLQTQSTVG